MICKCTKCQHEWQQTSHQPIRICSSCGAEGKFLGNDYLEDPQTNHLIAVDLVRNYTKKHPTGLHHKNFPLSRNPLSRNPLREDQD